MRWWNFCVFFEKLKQVLWFVNYMIKRHKDINFSFETKKDHSFSFLKVKIYREKDKCTTSVSKKDTFGGVNTNYSSFGVLEHKFGLVYTFLPKSFTIVSDFSRFRFDVEKIKNTLQKILTPQNLLTNA